MNSQYKLDANCLASNPTPISTSATPTMAAPLSSLLLHGASIAPALSREEDDTVPAMSVERLQRVLQSTLALIDDEDYDF